MTGPRVDKKTGIYHYRRRVPDRVRAAMKAADAQAPAGVPKSFRLEEKKSLGKEERRAEELWDQYNREVDARWKKILGGKKPLVLSTTQMRAIAGEIYHSWVRIFPNLKPSDRGMAMILLRGMEEIEEKAAQQPLARYTQEYRQQLESMHGVEIDVLLARHGISIAQKDRAALLQEARAAYMHALRTILKKIVGEVRSEPDEPAYPQWPDPAKTMLTALFASWVASRQPTVSTERAFRSSVDRFIAFLGHEDVTKMTVGDVRRWRDKLTSETDRAGKRKMGGIRIRDGHLAALKAVLSEAKSRGDISLNPAEGVKVSIPKSAETREKDLRDGEIFAILKASLQEYPLASDHVRNARRWVPWICAYTGARVAEITRLESRHFVRESGIDGISIERSKTGRARLIPVHRDLKKEGLLDLVEMRGGKPLFFDESKLADAHLVIHKTRAEGLADWVGGLEGVGEVAPNHGWRHRFETECRRIFMNEEIREYLLGHAFKNSGGDYGHFPLDVTAPWMEMFPRYDVSGTELIVHRKFDPGLLQRAAALLIQSGGSPAQYDEAP